MQHIIRKQIIELRLTSRQNAFRIQNRVSEHYWHDLLPVMENLFDEVATEEETLYIDTLEIDLGVLTEKDIGRQIWDDEILALITNQLRSTLKQYETGFKKTVERQSTSIGICRQWLFYMRRGYLPWNVLQTSTEWRQNVLEALSTEYESIAALRKLIRLDKDALTRIIEQHEDSFLVKLVEILTAQKQAHLPELLGELEILYRAWSKADARIDFIPEKELRKTFWRITLGVAAADEEAGEAAVFVHRILEKCFGRMIRPGDLPKEVLSNLPRLEPFVRSWEKETEISGTDTSPEIAERMVMQQNGQGEETEDELDPEEEIFVQQAGAVLLHPFLSTFYSRLELTEAGAFKDLAAQQKGLYLVHYLCTGTAEAEEHELVIPKVLCGYPLQKPVKKSVRFTHEEKDEADHLLEELVRQWEKLKNTSPTGLREGFLQRGGKLLTKNEGWYIQVEVDTIDVLLDHLPWNLSIIKLPWMKDMIRVEWR